MRRAAGGLRVFPWPLTLRWKLVLASVGVLAIVVASFGVVLYRDLSAAVVDATASGLDASAHTVIMQETREGIQRASPPNGAPLGGESQGGPPQPFVVYSVHDGPGW